MATNLAAPAAAADAEDHLYVDAACEAEILELAAEAAVVRRPVVGIHRAIEDLT